MTKLNDLAPYPVDSQTATAGALARNYAVLAAANLIRGLEGPTPDVRHEGLSLAMGLFSVVHLLKALAEEAGGNAANLAAQELLEDLASPQCIGPMVREWLTEFGIDADEVDRITRALPEMQPEPAVSEGAA
jgi:hypothetical protein